MPLAFFDRTRAPAPTPASARGLHLNSLVRNHLTLGLNAPLVCARQSIDLFSGEFASAVYSTGEVEA